jgi:hypothetical protein
MGAGVQLVTDVITHAQHGLRTSTVAEPGVVQVVEVGTESAFAGLATMTPTASAATTLAKRLES